jgi:selenocysteine lyase/cysteine desulfurase
MAETAPRPQEDFAGFRSVFPALNRLVWLNTPTSPPAARPVLDALSQAERQWEDGSFSWEAWEDEAHATRALFARLIGAVEDEVALVSSLAEAAATVARSLPVGRVVVGEREFRSNLFPWLMLERVGFDVVEVPATNGVVSTRRLVQAIEPGTVLVAVSEVQSSNGFRASVAEIAERSREVGARLFLNLTQSLGALRFDVSEVGPDFVAAHGYKWLLGPRGAAWLYVRRDRLGELEPIAPNWRSVADPYLEYYGGPLDLPDQARKLDASLSWFAFVGARRALELILSLDSVAVESRCLELASALRDAARRSGYHVVPEEVRSHIVGLEVVSPDDVQKRLADRRVVASVRGGFLRLGFHAFNNEGDVEAALEALGNP